MQLEKIVSYHKAMADPTRIRILILLSEGELNGQVLAEKLAVSPPTVTHHAAKLREVGLIHERREKNTIFFSLNKVMLEQKAKAILDLLGKRKGRQNREDEEMTNEKDEKFRDAVLNNFFTKDGRLKHIPSQLKKKLIVFEYMVDRLERGTKYTEKEINQYIQMFHEDFATIRREWIMHQFMYRDNNIYELNPREMWAQWQELS
jgi:DNA-binding transcriptional ArsR family regulator